MGSYAEGQLVTNRVSVLLFGGTEGDRKAWAEEACEHLADDGPLVEAKDATALNQALSRRGGVVYVPDATQVSWAVQRELTRLLREREERPKFVFGLPATVTAAVQKGQLRDDLLFALSKSTIDLGHPAVKDAINNRRKKSKKPR